MKYKFLVFIVLMIIFVAFKSDVYANEYNKYYMLRDAYSYIYPNDKSTVAEELYIGNEIELKWFNKGWWYYFKDGKAYYVKTTDITKNSIGFIEYDISDSGNKSFKSFMPYQAITSKSSLQYKIQHTLAHTGDNGVRMVKDRYCVALGTAFNIGCGQYVDLILEDGNVIKCILSDIKDDKHTMSNHIVTRANGCATEFIVDKKSLNKDTRIMGDVSYSNKLWKSKVKFVRVYKYNIFN